MNFFHSCTNNGWKQFARADDLQLGHVCILSYDNSGTMLMNGKTYLAFDELMLYIGTTKKELQKYKIERVNCIE